MTFPIVTVSVQSEPDVVTAAADVFLFFPGMPFR